MSSCAQEQDQDLSCREKDINHFLRSAQPLLDHRGLFAYMPASNCTRRWRCGASRAFARDGERKDIAREYEYLQDPVGTRL